MEAQRTGRVKRRKINTKNILFVMSGAFFSLPDIIRRRLNRQPLGFQAGVRPSSLLDDDVSALKLVRSEDLIQFGFESEFVGRLPVVVNLNDLDVDGLYAILKNPNSTVILGKKRDFKAYGIEIKFTDEALKRIAELAFEEHTGARGLVSVIDRILLKFEKVLPDTEISEFEVTRETVDHPGQVLDRVLTPYYIKNFQKRFLSANGIIITFTDEAVELLKKRAVDEGKTLETVCNDMLRDYEYGLRLLDCVEFTVDKEIVQNPKKRLEQLIKKSYHNK